MSWTDKQAIKVIKAIRDTKIHFQPYNEEAMELNKKERKAQEKENVEEEKEVRKKLHFSNVESFLKSHENPENTVKYDEEKTIVDKKVFIQN